MRISPLDWLAIVFALVLVGFFILGGCQKAKSEYSDIQEKCISGVVYLQLADRAITVKYQPDGSIVKCN